MIGVALGTVPVVVVTGSGVAIVTGRVAEWVRHVGVRRTELVRVGALRGRGRGRGLVMVMVKRFPDPTRGVLGRGRPVGHVIVSIKIRSVGSASSREIMSTSSRAKVTTRRLLEKKINKN